MFKYLIAAVAALVIGISVADAQTYNHNTHHSNNGVRVIRNRQVRVIVSHPRHQGFRVIRNTYAFRFNHVPTVAVYGTFAQYQQFGFAVVGYNNLAAVQSYCGAQGLQIVQVNPVQNFVVVRVPATFGWHQIQSFSRINGVRFVEPGFRRY